MAVDNLNFYSNWLPAWQQTDKYSSQPWCLRSKNLDIFSSSKSVKATAWSEPTTTGSDIVAQDGDLVLKTDWIVYEDWAAFLNTATNWYALQVSYNGWASYSAWTWGTVKDMVVKYEWDEWKSFAVFTDRASLVYSKEKFVVKKTIGETFDCTYQGLGTEWYYFVKANNTSSTMVMNIYFNNPWINKSIPIRLYANSDSSTDNCFIENVRIRSYKDKILYDPEIDTMIWVSGDGGSSYRTDTWKTWTEVTATWWVDVNVPCSPLVSYMNIEITVNFVQNEWATNYRWGGLFYIDMNDWPTEWHYMKYANWTTSDGDYNYYYAYLPIEDRKLKGIWEYFWLKWSGTQTLYSRQGEWKSEGEGKVVIYDFIQYMWYSNDVSMDVISMIAWNEQIYMIGNMNWNWYIFPCDLSWGRGTPYIAYGCTFKWATNIDYLLYLVWENRGISQFWVYNGQELVPILWGNEEKGSKNLLKTDEQYKFSWNIVEYRGNLILSTEDWRILEYGQTYWGKWGSFIHELPSGAVITELKAKDNNLSVKYDITTTHYLTVYQDDVPVKNYNTEWMAEYPIVIWNHLIEKEESDLYASYILPNSNCKLEFWGMANHYHFWTFKSADNYTFSTTASYKLKGCTWNYALKYIEKNGDEYTFRLEWDLPVQNWTQMKITDTEWTELITYTSYNHFRKIWEITTDGYQEWEFRFHNLNNKLELPKSYSLQIMVKGKGTANYTPELFAVDLVANQRDRW